MVVCPPWPAKAVSRAKRVSPFYPSPSPSQPLSRHPTENHREEPRHTDRQTDTQTEVVRKESGRNNLTQFINNYNNNMTQLVSLYVWQQHHVCKYVCNELHMLEHSLYFCMHMHNLKMIFLSTLTLWFCSRQRLLLLLLQWLLLSLGRRTPRSVKSCLQWKAF